MFCFFLKCITNLQKSVNSEYAIYASYSLDKALFLGEVYVQPAMLNEVQVRMVGPNCWENSQKSHLQSWASRLNSITYFFFFKIIKDLLHALKIKLIPNNDLIFRFWKASFFAHWTHSEPGDFVIFPRWPHNFVFCLIHWKQSRIFLLQCIIIYHVLWSNIQGNFFQEVNYK